MKYEANTIDEYIDHVPEDRTEALMKLHKVLQDNLPLALKEQMSYGMPAFVVPHTVYPDGYHCDTKQPLPFVNYASQKNFIALYHMGVYAFPEIMEWFKKEYPKHCKRKLDMGKSCIRFKRMDDIPYELIAELCRKISVDDWITKYEEVYKK